MKVPQNREFMAEFIDRIPEKYRVGPWSPAAHLFLGSIIFYLFRMWPDAKASYDALVQEAPPTVPDELFYFRGATAVYSRIVYSDELEPHDSSLRLQFSRRDD